MPVGEQLRAARRAAGITQKQLADRSGLHQPTVSAIERGLLNPQAETVARLKQALRRRPSEVLDEHRAQIRDAVAARRGGDVRVFGSVAHGADTVESDLDLLVTFDDGASYFDAVGLRLDLEALLGVRVDIVSDDGDSATLARARADGVSV